jgi:hypothetical protein
MGLANQCLKILLMSANLWYFGEGLFGPLFAVFAQQIGGSLLDVSWAWGLYLVLTGVLAIAVGRLAITERRSTLLLLAGYLLNALFTFAYLRVTSPVHLFIVQSGLGVATALSSPTWSALYAEHQEGKAGLAASWGLAAGEQKILTGVAVISGGLIAQRFTFTGLFIVMGAIQLLAAGYQAQFHRDTLLAGLLRPTSR